MQRPSSDYLIPKKLFNFTNWKSALNEMGITNYHTPHDTRHTCILKMRDLNVDRDIIKDVLMHLTLSQIYTEDDIEYSLVAIDML